MVISLKAFFNTVNLLLLLNALALWCWCVKLSMLNLLFPFIFQLTHIPLDIIHTKVLKEVKRTMDSSTLSIVNGLLHSNGIPDYLKKASLSSKKEPHLIHGFLLTTHILKSYLFYLKGCGACITKRCQELMEWSKNSSVLLVRFFPCQEDKLENYLFSVASYELPPRNVPDFLYKVQVTFWPQHSNWICNPWNGECS